MTIAKMTNYVFQKWLYNHEGVEGSLCPNDLQKILTRLGLRFSEEVYVALSLPSMMDDLHQEENHIVLTDETSKEESIHSLLQYYALINNVVKQSKLLMSAGFALMEPEKLLDGINAYCIDRRVASLGAKNDAGARDTVPDLHLRHEIQNDAIIRQFCETYNVWDSMTFAPYVQFLWRGYTNALGKQSVHLGEDDEMYAKKMESMLTYIKINTGGTKHTKIYNEACLIEEAYKMDKINDLVELVSSGILAVKMPEYRAGRLQEAWMQNGEDGVRYFVEHFIDALDFHKISRTSPLGKLCMKNLKDQLSSEARRMCVPGIEHQGQGSQELGLRMLEFAKELT